MKEIFSLFLAFVKIGAMAFGGAYASIPLVEREVVEIHGWLTYEEFGNLLALDELTPGPILINSATFVGSRVAGVPGAVAATLGSIFPACVISLSLLAFYRKYRSLDLLQSVIYAVKCMTVGLILVTVIRTASSAILLPESALGFDPLLLILAAVSVFVLKKWDLNPLWVMLGCGLVNLAAAALRAF